MTAAILIVEDEAILAKNIATYLTRHGYDAVIASSGEEALQRLETLRPDVVLADYALPGISGIDVLRSIKALDRRVPVVLMTGHGSEQVAVEAMKAGASDYLIKPIVLGEVKLLLEKLSGQERLEEELGYHRRRIAAQAHLDQLVGNSATLQRLKDSIRQLLAAEASMIDGPPPAVLITGETGAGKQLVARALHFEGARKEGPFVELNCSTIPPDLLEAELFGYERGAFTDARQRKLGLIEAAESGTLFLDEIGDLDLRLQVKLLKLLEDKMVRRLGSVREQKANVRVIAATNRDLGEAVRKGDFRADLLFRLNIVHLHVPSLRERSGDVDLLADHYLALLRQRYRKGPLALGADARAAMAQYRWPGNVRELRNVLEQAVIMTRGDVIGLEELRLPTGNHIDSTSVTANGHRPASDRDARPADDLNVVNAERELLVRALANTDGNVTQAARLLGISRDALRYRIEKFNLKVQ
ncbi:MAG: sigma-54-dependent transcriptional regulator [Deltaproteobacteria bacterium]|jgi:DNA-binding NtrC family response regulator